jgi:hypothetical protein
MNGVHYKTALENRLLRFMELHKTQWFIRAGMGRLKEIENTFSIMDWPEKFPQSQSHRELLVLYEAQAEEGPHHQITSKADHCHQDDVGDDMPLAYFQKLAKSMLRGSRRGSHKRGR